MPDIRTFIEANKERFMEEYFALLRICSISPGNLHPDECRQAGELIHEYLNNAGCANTSLIETEHNPLVYGEMFISESLPTVLIYGHYDVMPAEIEDGWDTDPFEPVIHDGKVYARGAEDNKGQLFILLKTIEYLGLKKSLNCNIKCIIDGEEETGSPGLTEFLHRDTNLLKADIAVICDTDMLNAQTPAIVISTRGGIDWDIQVRGPVNDLHSGIYGGAIVNPVKELVRVIGSLYDKNGRVTLPGFYDDVREYSRNEREDISEQSFDEEELRSIAGVEIPDGEIGYSSLERIAIRPTLEITGISGGYTGEGMKAIVPSLAKVKIFARMVPDQDIDSIYHSLEKYLEKELSDSVTLECRKLGSCPPYLCDTGSDYFRYMEDAAEEVFEKKPVKLREGGSIGILTEFKEKLSVDSVLMGFGLKSDNIHGPNEHFAISNMWKGMETLDAFFRRF